MRACAIVPQKTLALAKGRLAAVLPASARAALSLALLRSVCTALRATPAIEEVVVMTPDPEVRAFAAALGVTAAPDLASGLNDALLEAFRTLPIRSRAVLIVSADLPLLRPADAAAMLAAGEATAVVIAPSRDAGGTNALLIPPAIPFRPAFGRGSRAAHRDRARAGGLGLVEVCRPGLAFDVDTPADLTEWQGRGWNDAAGRVGDDRSVTLRRSTL